MKQTDIVFILQTMMLTVTGERRFQKGQVHMRPITLFIPKGKKTTCPDSGHNSAFFWFPGHVKRAGSNQETALAYQTPVLVPSCMV